MIRHSMWRSGGGGAVLRAVALGLSLVLLQACGPSSDSAGLPSSNDPAAGSAGPALGSSEETLRASLNCSPGLETAQRPAILLVHATAVTPDLNYGWNYIPALDALGWPWCTVALPNQAMSDIQESAEFVVFAIREMHRITGRKIQILGQSLGGHAPRWALRYWPGTRDMVEDLVSFAAANHGTPVVTILCLIGGCAPAVWQQNSASAYTRALNCDTETYPQIAYTNIYTHTDEFVQPNLDDSGTSSLAGGDNVENVAVQDLCPVQLADHLTIGTSDAMAYALAMDALTHEGPADPSRIPPSVCLQPFMPGVNPATFLIDLGTAAVEIVEQLTFYPRVPAEPPLKDYVPQRCKQS
ncbi:MAG: esterase/lipase family protein [Nevskiales bacterium]